MPEMSGKCKSNPTKTNNLIYILNRPQKEETYQQTENLKLFLKKLTPKKEETDPKKGETDQQTESLKLFLKTGN